MEKIDFKSLDIKFHQILVVYTSEPDYEMLRKILLEVDYETYVIIEGSHCSCYGFDDTEWEAIKYSREELRKLSNAEYNKDDIFWQQVKIQMK